MAAMSILFDTFDIFTQGQICISIDLYEGGRGVGMWGELKNHFFQYVFKTNG